ncbi:hypothetical protein TNCV_143531 [Trichonephila clavipes]|nr:hypothetical protein TNCV_143531 [Trichonephila clavipes]
MHFGSRVQSVEECPTAAHLEHIQQPVVASGEPPLCNAGPHPGTTWNYKTGGIIHQLIEQPGHAGWPSGSCTIWRPETQNSAFLGTLYMAASSKTPPHQSKDPQKFKTRSKCQFSQGAFRCVIIPIVKNHQTQLHPTQSWSATGLRGRKIKIS